MKRLVYLLLAEILCLGNLSVSASEVHFSEIDKFIINQIDSAKSSVKVCVFIYEWQPIADALIRAHKRGIEVELLTDYRSVNLQNRGAARRYNYAIYCRKWNPNIYLESVR